MRLLKRPNMMNRRGAMILLILNRHRGGPRGAYRIIARGPLGGLEGVIARGSYAGTRLLGVLRTPLPGARLSLPN